MAKQGEKRKREDSAIDGKMLTEGSECGGIIPFIPSLGKKDHRPQ
jgi:hypothetical protein